LGGHPHPHPTRKNSILGGGRAEPPRSPTHHVDDIKVSPVEMPTSPALPLPSSLPLSRTPFVGSSTRTKPTLVSETTEASKIAVISMGLSEFHKEVSPMEDKNTSTSKTKIDERSGAAAGAGAVSQSDVRRSFVSTVSQTPSLYSSNTPTHPSSSSDPLAGSRQKPSTTRGANSLTPPSSSYERKTPQHTPTRSGTTGGGGVPTVSLDLSKSFRSPPGKRSMR
jgi:hypothetical protein